MWHTARIKTSRKLSSQLHPRFDQPGCPYTGNTKFRKQTVNYCIVAIAVSDYIKSGGICMNLLLRKELRSKDI